MKKVIVPTDFSRASLNALNYAITFFKEQKTELILFHAVEYPVPVGMEYGIVNGDVLTQQLNSAVSQASQKLEAVIRTLPKSDNISYEYLVEVGSLVSWVRNQLPETNADLMVMSTTGASGLKGIFVGSNTEKVVRCAACPVISIPKDAKWQPVVDIVVPFESKELSDEFLKALKDLQSQLNAGLQMIWVKTPNSQSPEEDLISEMIDSMHRHGFKKFKVNTRRSYSPAQGVIAFTAEVKGAMVAMPTHGRKGLRQLLQNSVTEEVVNQSVIPVWSFNLGNIKTNTTDQKSRPGKAKPKVEV